MPRRNRFIYVIRHIFILTWLTCADFARAQDYLDMSLEDLMQIKVSGATLRDDVIKNLPAVVTVFTAEQIDRLGMDYLYELLNLVPGFQFTRNGDNPTDYTYSARGRRIGAQSREILVLVDGRDFSDPRSYSADATFNLFPLEFIERIEIIRGPSSALYGSNAINGTINIITRKNARTFGWTMGHNYANGAFVQASNSLGDLQADLALKLYRDIGDDYVLQTGPANTTASTDPRESVDLNASLRFRDTTLRITHHDLKSSEFYTFESINNDFNYYSQAFSHISLEQQIIQSTKLSSSLLFSYLYTEQITHLQVFPEGALVNLSVPSSSAAFLGKAIIKAQNYRINSANDWTINETSSVQFGASLLSNQVNEADTYSNYNFTQLANNQFPLTSYETLSYKVPLGLEDQQSASGLYAQYLNVILPRTRLALGARYDYYRDIGGQFSPRLGLIHQLDDHNTLKLLYGEAFRAPALVEIGAINAPGQTNPDLTYETIKTLELAWRGEWKHTAIGLNGFRSRYTDPISAGFVGSQNNNDAQIDGVEFEASQEFFSHWLLQANLTKLLNLPEESFREADLFGSIALNFSHQNWNWNISTLYQAERKTLITADQNHALDAFWFTNTKLSYQFLQAFKIQMQIKNMFDKAIYTPALGYSLPDGIPHRGREISFGFTWQY
jgi:outer membrane cobalamin receptor